VGVQFPTGLMQEARAPAADSKNQDDYSPMNFFASLARNGARMITWQGYNMNDETTFIQSPVAEPYEFTQQALVW
jgi:hypothetical protein